MKAIHIKMMSLKQRILALLLSILLLFGCIVGATLAWLTAKTNPVINTFSGSNLTISLAETQQETYQMIPGVEIAKNPYVTVEAGSEPCYVFVKAEESATFANYVDYTLANGWQPYNSFTIDGELDSFYKTDAAWYFDSTNGAYNVSLKSILSSGTGTYSGASQHDVKLWLAYDSSYVYAYVKMYDTSVNADDSIRLYYDPDPYSRIDADSANLTAAWSDSSQGDVEVMIKRDDTIQPSTDTNIFLGKSAYGGDPKAYFQNLDNVVMFTFDDNNDGTDEGFGAEIRFPRYDDYTNSFSFNIATESATDTNKYAWTFGENWWINFDSMKTFQYDSTAFVDSQYDGWFYRVVDDSNATLAENGTIANDQTYYVLSGSTTNPNGMVRVRTDLTNETLSTVAADSGVTLTFTACALQKANLSLEQAFAIAQQELGAN